MRTKTKVDFEGLSPRNNDTYPIPLGYADMDWVNVGAVDQDTFRRSAPGTGYENAREESAAYNGFGDRATMSLIGDGTFKFRGGFFGGAFNDGLCVRVIGYRDGDKVGETSFEASTDGIERVDFGDIFRRVDTIEFLTSGGEEIGYGFFTQLVMDNLVLVSNDVDFV